jgi:hypothetical protein
MTFEKQQIKSHKDVELNIKIQLSENADIFSYEFVMP